LQDGNWHIPGYDGEYTLEEAANILGEKFYDTTLYKDQWYIVGKGDKELSEHFIVTYSKKYADYQLQTRQEQIYRAQTKIDRGESARPKSPNDCRRFITTTHATNDGEIAELSSSVIDENKVADEARFDGLYALATSLDDTPGAILRANHFRYEIEALFRVTKTDLELRPIYLQRKDRITGHFIVCFIALLMIKRLQKQLGSIYSVEQIISQLKSLKYLLIEAHGYIPSFDRTEMLDDIQYAMGKRIDSEIITKPAMRALVRELSQG
jgi:hypothetical protein